MQAKSNVNKLTRRIRGTLPSGGGLPFAAVIFPGEVPAATEAAAAVGRPHPSQLPRRETPYRPLPDECITTGANPRIVEHRTNFAERRRASSARSGIDPFV